MNLPTGVALRPLTMNRDSRGSFTEVFRDEWNIGLSPVQWNAVSSEAGTLRGVHLHIRHDDYLTTLRGRACVGLRDLR
ncbi:MAG TPA: dTDP-4-dehydrorhamnose 3,5-epimerase family protein, partial [Gaiellaceae bacterium]